MSKRLNYCSSCEEGFAERFAFCPNCGATLQIFELNPVTGDTSPKGDVIAINPEVSTVGVEATPAQEETTVDTSSGAESALSERSWSANSLVSDGPAPSFVLPKSIRANEASTFAFVSDGEAPAFKFPKLKAADGSLPPLKLPQIEDEVYGVTVINDRNSKEKNGLLFGSTAFMVIALLSITVYSMFLKPYDIGSISGDDLFAYIPEVEPDPVDLTPEKRDKDKGGGGGKEDPNPVAKGTLPNMIRRPDVLPSSEMVRIPDPDVTQRVGIEGDKRLADFNKRYGLPTGAEDGGDGPGIGGAIGTGRGPAVGPGTGPGLGPGSKPGLGGDDSEDKPPDAIAKLTVPLKIISKPKAQYTAEARQNLVVGSVTLKITFLASGQIGTVTAITRLPYGLTENAIAAAKLIKFEPKMVNGRAVPVTLTFEYGFNIY